MTERRARPLARALAVLCALLLVVSPVAPLVGFAGSAAAAPSGMATIPDSAVTEDAPTSDLALSASELRGGVLASEHADTLELILTTADHAPTVMDGDAAAVSGDGMALVLRDREHSAGREVAIDAGQLQDALGHEPQAIYGTHEDGSEWTASAEYEDGYLVFDVPHFSDNTVTFAGEVDVSLTGATNGTSIQWTLDDYDSSSNVTVNLTGQTATESDSITGSVQVGNSFDPSISSGLEPTGPSGGEPQLEVTAVGPTVNENPIDNLGGGSRDGEFRFVGQTSGSFIYSEFGINPDKSGQINVIEPYVADTPSNAEPTQVDVYITPGSPNGDVKEGTKVVSGHYIANSDSQLETKGYDYISLDTSYEVTAGQNYTVEFVTTSVVSTTGTIYDIAADSANGDYVSSGYANDNQLSLYANAADLKYSLETGVRGVSASANNSGAQASFGDLGAGETARKPINLTKSDMGISVSADSSGSVNYNLTYTERVQTQDPAIQLNGNSTTLHSGTLAAGETVEATIPKSQLRKGSNELTASLGDGSLSADAPDMQADIDLSHETSDKISVGYNATTFEESYNLSHSYADATADATATIPFASDRVVDIKTVEYRVNGGTWQSVDAANYRFEGTTVDVYLSDAYGGELPSGATAEVRTTARKISVANGQVTVTDPTAPGEPLDTQLQIDSRSPGFHVNVGPTDDGDRVHYAYSDVFPTEDYVIIDASGDQKLYLPNSKTGDSLRVKHLDTRVVADRGDVRIDVVEAGTTPELDVSPGPGGSGDPVTIKYYNTESGSEYLLESLARSIVVDSDVAQSPAIFEDDDSDDTWQIVKDTGETVSGDSGDSGVVRAAGQFAQRSGGAPSGLPLVPIALGGVSLAGVVLLLRARGEDVDDAAETTTETATTAAETTGSLLEDGLRGLLGFVGDLVGILTSNRRAAIATGVIGAIIAARVGVFQLPEGTGILIVVAGVPIASWLILRRTDAVSQRVWLASTIAATVLGLEFVAPGTVQTAITQLTGPQVAPLLLLLIGGAAFLYLRARRADASTPDEVTNVDLGITARSDDDGGDD